MTRAHAPVLLSTFLATLLAACSGHGGSEGGGRGVLVIAIDALRADHLWGWEGYDRPTTPLLEVFAQEGVKFTNAWSPGPGVVPAHVALLTGCDPAIATPPPLPTQDGTELKPLFEWLVPGAVPRLAQEFLAAGWSTGAFVDHPKISGLRGFDQGFRYYFDAGGERGQGRPLFGFEGVGSRFVQWVHERDEDENWFAYVHMSDLERIWSDTGEEVKMRFSPRSTLASVPPVAQLEPVCFAVPSARAGVEPLSIGEYEARYDSALYRLDWNLDNLFSHLQRAEGWDRTTVVVVGSFGLGFGESGMILQSGTLSDVDLHVPLIVRPEPSYGFEPGVVVEHTVSLIDLAPTLLELAGIERPAGMHGLSLVGAMRGEVQPPRSYAFAASGVYAGFAVMDDRWCYERSVPGSRGRGPFSSSWYGDDFLHDEVRELLHDRRADPTPGHLERRVEDSAVAARMETAGREWYGLMERARDVLHPLPWEVDAIDPREVAELQALGVIGELD